MKPMSDFEGIEKKEVETFEGIQHAFDDHLRVATAVAAIREYRGTLFGWVEATILGAFEIHASGKRPREDALVVSRVVEVNLTDEVIVETRAKAKAAGLKTCASESCICIAMRRYTWPGDAPRETCTGCADGAARLARLMGFVLQVEDSSTGREGIPRFRQLEVD